MDSEYIQQIRYKLQKRLKRLNTAGYTSLHYVLVQVWGFLQGNEVTKGILDDLECRSANEESVADEIFKEKTLIGTTESEHNSICYWVVKKCVSIQSSDNERVIGSVLLHGAGDTGAHLEAFRETYLEPLFDYIDEHIDDKRVVLVLLKKFKHRCEWFHRESLFEKFKDETGQGERNLAKRLYEYLHDQGVQFHIEPESVAGRIDLISTQTGKDRLVADAKLFNPDRKQDRGYIIKAFRQVYDYAKEYNETFGYLVIFKTGETDLSIPTANQESSVPFITHNNKTIFLLVIDIFEYAESASKRGKLNTHEIKPEEFVATLT